MKYIPKYQSPWGQLKNTITNTVKSAVNYSAYPIKKTIEAVKEYQTEKRKNLSPQDWISNFYSARKDLLADNFLQYSLDNNVLNIDSKSFARFFPEIITDKVNSIPIYSSQLESNYLYHNNECNGSRAYHKSGDKDNYIVMNIPDTDSDFNSTLTHELTHEAEPFTSSAAVKKAHDQILESGTFMDKMLLSRKSLFNENSSYWNKDYEIYARRNQMWKDLGLPYNYKLTDDDYKKYKTDGTFEKYNLNYPKDFLKTLYNDIAANLKTTNSNIGLAKHGCKISYLNFFK